MTNLQFCHEFGRLIASSFATGLASDDGPKPTFKSKQNIKGNAYSDNRDGVDDCLYWLVHRTIRLPS